MILIDGTTMAVYGIIGYSIFVVTLGAWASRRVNILEDFAVAGRRLGPVLVFGTVLATWFGGGTAIGGASMAYSFGLRGIIMDPLGAGVAVILFALFFASMMRKLRYITIADFFKAKYGEGMEMAATIVNIVAYTGWTGALLVAFSTIFNVVLDIPIEYGIWLATAITITYAFAGGMWSVTLTDFVQVVLLILGTVIMIPFVIDSAGGWGEISQVTSMGDYSILPSKNFGYLGYFGIFGFMFWMSSWIVQGLGAISCQDLMQRGLSAKDEFTAKWASFGAGIGYWTVGILPALVAIWGRAVVPNLDNPDLILPTLANKVLPDPIFALFVVALFAAVMSSADSSMIIPPTMITQNLLPKFKPNLSEKKRTWIARGLVPVIGIGALLIALYGKTVFFLMNLSWELILMVQGIPFILGTYWSKANRLGAYASIIVNFGVWIPGIYLTLSHTMEVEGGAFKVAIWDSIFIAALPALLCGLIAFITVSLLTQERDPPSPITDMDGNVAEEHTIGDIERDEAEKQTQETKISDSSEET